MTKTKIKELTKHVEAILKEHPKARNSDQWLTLKIWATYYKSRIKQVEEKLPDGTTRIRKYVFLDDILELPREDNVKRIRAHFQNDFHMYPPTDKSVIIKRGQEQIVWRDNLGY